MCVGNTHTRFWKEIIEITGGEFPIGNDLFRIILSYLIIIFPSSFPFTSNKINDIQNKKKQSFFSHSLANKWNMASSRRGFPKFSWTRFVRCIIIHCLRGANIWSSDIEHEHGTWNSKFQIPLKENETNRYEVQIKLFYSIFFQRFVMNW